ncbi:MAG TPA: serine/threonine-protein kinase [Polyangiaceae bacterium]|jgi:serine/threonine protein kinase|nr:serine/threonine-protein kinase [Polyangiaceae bacterium]
MQPPPSLFSPYPQPGEVLDGKYRIERMLGEGGMGAVAKATHLLRRAPVALKFMSPAILSMAGTVERFVNEGVAASQIDSDHVVKVFDVGRLSTGAPYLVMEFLDGRDLSDVITHEGPRIASTRSVHFTLQMLRALHTAHTAGIVHRDMKPSNCFVIEKDGEPDFLKLVDFGISKVRVDDERASNLTRTNSALGTPLYMSPEQARSPRDVDARSDLYSVGAILYEMLCGRTPYTSESGEYTEILFKIFTTEPEPLRSIQPDVADGLADVVHRALLRDRDARFSSALDMAEALAPFADERSSDLIARMRGVRGRSIVPSAIPAAMSRATPPMPPSSDAAAAPAQTFPPASPEALRAPKVPTDLGLSRSAAGGPRPTSRSAAALGIAAGVATIAICVAAGVFVLRNHAAPPPGGTAGSAGTAGAASTVLAVPATRAPATAAANGPPSAVNPAAEPIVAASPSPAAPSEASAVVLVPAPSAAPSAARPPAAPSAGAGTAETAPKSSARAWVPGSPGGPGAPPPPGLPTQLGDLKLH